MLVSFMNCDHWTEMELRYNLPDASARDFREGENVFVALSSPQYSRNMAYLKITLYACVK